MRLPIRRRSNKEDAALTKPVNKRMRPGNLRIIRHTLSLELPFHFFRTSTKPYGVLRQSAAATALSNAR